MVCKHFISAAIIITLTSGCNHKELCFDHPDHAPGYNICITASYNLVWEIPYHSQTDWLHKWNSSMGVAYESLNPAIPDGLRVVSYTGNSIPYSFNIPAEGCGIYLPKGYQSLLFYNNDTEYIKIVNEDSYALAMATTRARARQSYQHDNEFTVAPPDMLFGNWKDDFLNLANTTPETIKVTMHPLTFTYMIRYEFSHGIEYVALARGALAGMAQGIYLHSGVNSDSPATILFDCEIKTWGIEALVKSFGLPGFPNVNYNRAASNFAINLEVLLKNGKTLSFDMNVTPQMIIQPYGGVIYAGPFEIPDDIGSNNGSGFSVNVDDWGDEQDVDIML